MGTYVIKMPDVGEGIAEAELVEWSVKPGDLVREDEVVASVMTDKATVEIPSSVSGTVKWLGGEVGDQIAIGADLLHVEVEGEGNYSGPAKMPDEAMDSSGEEATPHKAEHGTVAEPEPKARATGQTSGKEDLSRPSPALNKPTRNAAGRPIASPSVRRQAREAGIDLRQVRGSGPAGRITHADLDGHSGGTTSTGDGRASRRKTTIEDIKVTGLRRRIAERMAEANARIPHITIVEKVDVTALEELRAQLNRDHAEQRGKLTVLPFIMRAIVQAVAKQHGLNAHYLDDEGLLRQFAAVHIGIATQTPNGLMVPVVRHAEAAGLWDAAAEISRLAEAARDGSASREELTGSTISISSLGPLGALSTTPIINLPEVAIVGVNKIAVRPVWLNGEFEPRQVMNISCSFDHRVIDGWDAAVFVQKLKSLLESPAVMFVEDQG